MKHFKINVDRKKLSSEHIQSKQNFNSVLNGTKLSKTSASIWKTTWFYGVVGMAGVAAVVGYYFNHSEKETHETIITQEIIKKQESKEEFEFPKPNALAFEDPTLLALNEPEQEVKSVRTNLVSFKEEKQVLKTETKDVVVPKAEAPVVEELVKTPVTKKTAKTNMPSISGVHNGDISWENFKEGEVFVGEDLAVKQFSIQYTTRMGDRTISVKGSKIPNEVVTDLEKLGLNQTIFITNVIAGDNTGELMRFVSMDLNLKFK